MTRWEGEIIGHRGAAALEAENTLASFEAAIAAGADRVEFDVRRTVDGHAVVFHDLNVDRFVPGSRGRSVTRHSLAEMRAIDAGAALGRRVGSFVPSLDETLEALRGRVRLNVEIKGSGADGLLTLPLAIEALRRHGLCGDTVISSFHLPILRRAAADAPDVARAFIFDARVAGDGVAMARANGCEAVHPQHGLVDEAMIACCRDAGLRLRAWTVNEPVDVLRMMALQVDGIVSDDPGRVRELRDTMPVS